MRNLKKFLALVLATMMLLSVAVISTSAAEKGDYTEAANHLAALQVMKGNEKGDLMLENGVTRYQAALFFVQALTGETEVAVWNADKKSANFTDVVEYGTAVDYANGIGIVKGRGNGVFGYNDAITYQDMLVMAVRALGYETADMSYPYGYILAAQKLGLTDKVDLVNYKAALTRGETAQIIWDMLGTQVAVVDPLTDKVYYPEANTIDIGTAEAPNVGYFTENSLGKFMPREELIVSSELAGDKITVLVDKFVEGDEEEETVDTLEVTVVGGEATVVTLTAADLGITADTKAVDYVGLPVEIYINVDEADFTQDNYDDGDAAVVFASFPEYTVVQNLDADGDVKYVANTDDADKSYLSIGGVKFTDGKYNVVTYEFVDGKWTPSNNVKAVFAYDDEAEGTPYTSGNSYGEVAYRVIESGDKNVKGTVEVLYTAYEFGQYNVREINGVKYTVIGTYNAAPYKNLDGVETNFIEYLVDGSVKVTENTKTISSKKGEAAATVTVEGEAVNAGDFMFYAYNETDNVLTVAMNAGKFETGRLTSHKKDAVKINNEWYEFGFAGSFDADYVASYDAEYAKDRMAKLEAGKDNVQFIIADGKIVYIANASVTSTNSVFDYAIITTDNAIMAKLADLTYSEINIAEEGEPEEWVMDPACKYAKALDSNGLYVEDGEVKAAMLNLTTGEWELVTIATIASEWDGEEFTSESDVANAAEYAEILGETAPAKYTDVIDAFKTLVAKTIVAVVEVEDGAYTIADNEADFFVTGATTEGILFSDNSNKTNAITADDELEAERVTVDEETIIVVVDGANVGVRVGVQGKYNGVMGAGEFLAASSDLIVFVAGADAKYYVDEVETALDVADWADGKTANADENWFIATANTLVEVERADNEDEELYVITVTNLYDMKGQAIVESLVMEDVAKNDVFVELPMGTVLKKEATDEMTVLGAYDAIDFAGIIEEVANDNEDKLEYSSAASFDFINADTILVGSTTTADAYDVNVTVVTLDFTNLDVADYDFENVVSAKDFVFTVGEEGDVGYVAGDENNQYKIGDVEITVDDPETEDVETENKWEYALDLDLINEITEPTEGVYDSYIAANLANILVPEVDNDDYADAVEVAVNFEIAYAIEDGVANIVVYKILTVAAE